MKNLFLISAALLLSAGAMAQEKSMGDSGMHKMKHKSKHTMGKMNEMDGCAMMMDGKMMTMSHGKSVPMTQMMSMTNGTTVGTDGTVKMKNGKTMMLKNGYCVEMNGEVEKMPMGHHMMNHRMKHPMMKDSTHKMRM